jgi:hypothetical protein
MTEPLAVRHCSGYSRRSSVRTVFLLGALVSECAGLFNTIGQPDGRATRFWNVHPNWRPIRDSNFDVSGSMSAQGQKPKLRRPHAMSALQLHADQFWRVYVGSKK